MMEFINLDAFIQRAQTIIAASTMNEGLYGELVDRYSRLKFRASSYTAEVLHHLRAGDEDSALLVFMWWSAVDYGERNSKWESRATRIAAVLREDIRNLQPPDVWVLS